jgi:hypothetical protein
MSEMNLHDRADALRTEQMEVQQRLQHAEAFDEVLQLLNREREIPHEIKAVAFALRAKHNRETRERAEEITAERRAKCAQLRTRIGEIRAELERTTDGNERDRLGRERDRLLNELDEWRRG